MRMKHSYFEDASDCKYKYFANLKSGCLIRFTKNVIKTIIVYNLIDTTNDISKVQLS